jgi:hypothetical protein
LGQQGVNRKRTTHQPEQSAELHSRQRLGGWKGRGSPFCHLLTHLPEKARVISKITPGNRRQCQRLQQWQGSRDSFLAEGVEGCPYRPFGTHQARQRSKQFGDVEGKPALTRCCSGKAKIKNPRLTLLIHEDIGRPEIPVGNARFLKELDLVPDSMQQGIVNLVSFEGIKASAEHPLLRQKSGAIAELRCEYDRRSAHSCSFGQKREVGLVLKLLFGSGKRCFVLYLPKDEKAPCFEQPVGVTLPPTDGLDEQLGSTPRCDKERH